MRTTYLEKKISKPYFTEFLLFISNEILGNRFSTYRELAIFVKNCVLFSLKSTNLIPSLIKYFVKVHSNKIGTLMDLV